MTTLLPHDLQARLGNYIAEEAISSVRHSVVNDLTALAALCYRLKIEHIIRIEDHGAARAAHDLLDNIQAYVGTASRRLAMTFIPEPETRPPTIDVRATLAALAARMPAPKGVQVQLPAEEPLLMQTDEPELELAVACLIANAYDAVAATGGVVRLRCSRSPGNQGRDDETVRIEVEHDGPALTTTVRQRVFDPFFSTKPGHLGIGLNIARRIAGRWGGMLDMSAAGPQGVVATLSLPVAPPPVEPL